MAILPIVTLPDPKLRAVSKPVAAVDDEVRAVLDAMLETMYDAPGIGLAAVQIGDLRRLVVMDTAKEDEPKAPLFLVNPEIVWKSEDVSVHEEGCLSIPDYYEEVERPERVRVRFLDRQGKPQELDFDGLQSTVVQHEIDHLEGVLFLDYLSRLKRDRVIKKFEKAARLGREGGRPAATERDTARPPANASS